MNVVIFQKLILYWKIMTLCARHCLLEIKTWILNTKDCMFFISYVFEFVTEIVITLIQLWQFIVWSSWIKLECRKTLKIRAATNGRANSVARNSERSREWKISLIAKTQNGAYHKYKGMGSLPRCDKTENRASVNEILQRQLCIGWKNIVTVNAETE